MCISPISYDSSEIGKYVSLGSGTLLVITSVALAIIVCVQPGWFNTSIGTIGSCWPFLTGAGVEFLLGVGVLIYGISSARARTQDPSAQEPERKLFRDRRTFQELFEDPSELDKLDKIESLRRVHGCRS